ncbi:dedicator of cytokinesis 9 DOCK9 transcript variant X11 mRNA [Crotalus adamanteus]|uniref:Dedicator of cytokinesis 9 DOCK9 transcript variant X11 mRNA n=1 Tax=Crotalus adamanteus TaxID=8729 RepID=A0AAW1C9X3_CROAD
MTTNSRYFTSSTHQSVSSNTPCFRCNQPGHRIAKCPELLPTARSEALAKTVLKKPLEKSRAVQQKSETSKFRGNEMEPEEGKPRLGTQLIVCNKDSEMAEDPMLATDSTVSLLCSSGGRHITQPGGGARPAQHILLESEATSPPFLLCQSASEGSPSSERASVWRQGSDGGGCCLVKGRGYLTGAAARGQPAPSQLRHERHRRADQTAALDEGGRGDGAPKRR